MLAFRWLLLDLQRALHFASRQPFALGGCWQVWPSMALHVLSQQCLCLSGVAILAFDTVRLVCNSSLLCFAKLYAHLM
jgi:hypothetical protein